MDTTLSPKQSKWERSGECLQRYLPSGTYYAVVRHQGKLIRQSLKTDDRHLAKRLLADFRRSLERVDLRAGKLTVAELADRYLATQSHLASKTQAMKRTITARLKSDWPGGASMRVRDVRESHVRTWLAEQGKRMGKTGYNAYVEYIRAAFKLAVADRLIADSPAAAIKQLKRDKPIRDTPTSEEFRAIVESIRAQRLHAECEDSADFVEFLGLSGLGNAEAAALQWKHIDEENGTIRAYRHKTDRGFTAPITSSLRPFLAKLRSRGAHSPEDFVFKIKSAKKALAAACMRLNLPHFSHRAFRRMFITRAIQRGVDVKTIAGWQGHRDGGKLILDTYSHVSQPHADEMAKLL